MNKLLADYDKQPIIPIGVVNGVMGTLNDEEYSTSENSDDEDFENYEQEYVNEEMKRYARFNAEAKNDKYGSMSEVEGVDEIDFKNNPLNVYSNYNFGPNINKKELPIDMFKDKILNILEVNNVVVIQGATGCGKTTQVPQYILDNCRIKNEYCNIAVTQPRRIATITVARRVCEERGWTLGTVCGYQVGLEKKTHPDMLLTYMTTGVLLQKLIVNKSLLQFTHIIIDEVHERNQDLDFLLVIVRRFLFTNSPRTKIILMSATIEAEEFAYYFRSQTSSQSISAPIIYVDKKNMFKNTIFYLDNLGPAIENTNCSFSFDAEKPEIGEGIWKLFIFLVSVTDRLDDTNHMTNQKIIGSILVFLPGIFEIEEAHKRLMNYYNTERIKERTESGEPKIKWQIIPLHSSLPNDEQAEAFKPPQPGHRKIILSTNIAESSITVPDSYYVIDFCQTKIMTVDPITKYMSLKLEWASHVNCEQRAGRVGRIANGRVYRLVTRRFYMEKMHARSLPEILRAPLERVVLQSKMLNLNDTPQQILALALNPPNIKNIDMTILHLKEAGGLMQTCKGSASNCDGDITFLGTIMANLPIDVKLSKLIALGHLFSCLEETIIMAAGCSIQNIFSMPFHHRFASYKKLLLWADGSFSDLVALHNLYQVWQSMKRDNQFEHRHAEIRWCMTNLVSLKGLREWNLLVTEIKQRLEGLGIINFPRQLQLNQNEKATILKIIAAGAFYPNFFIREPDTTHDEKEAVKLVGGRNPLRTVYLTGMDPAQPGPIYTSAIKELFKNDKEPVKDIAIGFDGSSKVYVEFKAYDRAREQVTITINGREMVTDSLPASIPSAVYAAIRKRQLKQPMVLKVLPLKEAWSFAESNGISRKSTLQKMAVVATASKSTTSNINCYTEVEFSPIPALDIEYITIRVTEFINAANFWANTLECKSHLEAVEEILNRTVLHGVLSSGEKISLDKIYATKFYEDNIVYRCQVISMHPNDICHVQFIDYGNVQKVKSSELQLLPDRPECKVAPLAIECVLHGIQPSRKMNPKGIWTEKINEMWKNEVMGILLYGKVHSVVDNVVYLESLSIDSRGGNRSINEQMLQRGHAEPAVESFLSKADHEKRLKVRKADNPNAEALRLSFDRVENYSDCKAPTFEKKWNMIELKGPFSPLEMKLYGCIETAANKSVDIEGTSVNTVLLDNEPQNYHTRLLVAGCVSQTAGGNRLRLRCTTLMPNIPGLPMILALMFCPWMKVKLTDDSTRVASILCGLGYSIYNQKPYFPAHDINLVLDTVLNEDIISKVNHIRFYMNQGLKTMNEIYHKMSSHNDLLKIQSSLKKAVMELVYEERKPVPRTNVNYANVWTRNNVDALVLKPSTSDDSEDIWPLLHFVKLKSTTDISSLISENLDELDRMARDMLPVDNAKCHLCKVILCTIYEVRLHLISQDHKENVATFSKELNEDEDDSDD